MKLPGDNNIFYVECDMTLYNNTILFNVYIYYIFVYIYIYIYLYIYIYIYIYVCSAYLFFIL